jgi:hypothetical protein
MARKWGEIWTGYQTRNATPLAQKDTSQKYSKKAISSVRHAHASLGVYCKQIFKKEALLSRNRRDGRKRLLVKRAVMMMCNS